MQLAIASLSARGEERDIRKPTFRRQQVYPIALRYIMPDKSVLALQALTVVITALALKTNLIAGTIVAIGIAVGITLWGLERAFRGWSAVVREKRRRRR